MKNTTNKRTRGNALSRKFLSLNKPLVELGLLKLTWWLLLLKLPFLADMIRPFIQVTFCESSGIVDSLAMSLPRVFEWYSFNVLTVIVFAVVEATELDYEALVQKWRKPVARPVSCIDFLLGDTFFVLMAETIVAGLYVPARTISSTGFWFCFCFAVFYFLASIYLYRTNRGGSRRHQLLPL